MRFKGGKNKAFPKKVSKFFGDSKIIRARYTDLHRATPLERYELLLRRCPGIARHLPLNAIA